MDKKIAIFGGSFDPFTPAHEAIVDTLVKSNRFDKILISPTLVRYHRAGKTPWLDATERLNIIAATIRKNKWNKVFLDTYSGHLFNMCVSDERMIQRYVNENRYCDLLVFHHLHEWADYYTVIGSDSLANLKTWTLWDQVVRLSKIIVVNGRDGETVQSDIPHEDIFIDDKLVNLSASHYRKEYADTGRGYEAYCNEVMGIKFGETK